MTTAVATQIEYRVVSVVPANAVATQIEYRAVSTVPPPQQPRVMVIN